VKGKEDGGMERPSTPSSPENEWSCVVVKFECIKVVVVACWYIPFHCVQYISYVLFFDTLTSLYSKNPFSLFTYFHSIQLSDPSYHPISQLTMPEQRNNQSPTLNQDHDENQYPTYEMTNEQEEHPSPEGLNSESRLLKHNDTPSHHQHHPCILPAYLQNTCSWPGEGA
jgi:hypothetical protein